MPEELAPTNLSTSAVISRHRVINLVPKSPNHIPNKPLAKYQVKPVIRRLGAHFTYVATINKTTTTTAINPPTQMLGLIPLSGVSPELDAGSEGGSDFSAG